MNNKQSAAVRPNDPKPSRKEWALGRLKILDARLGVGKGAARERKRLGEIINNKE